MNIIGTALAPRVTPMVTDVTAKKAKRKRNVQLPGGELITAPGCIARLAELDEEKAKKKKKGPASKPKAGPSGVSITMKAPTAKPAQSVSGGTLDGFVSVGSRDIPEAEESQQQEASQQQDIQVQEELPSAPAQVQSSLPSVLCKPSTFTGEQSHLEEVSVYKDASTTEDSEVDLDDPRPTSGGSTLSKVNKGELYKKLRSSASHVIFCYEGSYFPGLVTKKKNPSSITVKTMQKCLHGASFWCWPKEERFLITRLDDIAAAIPAPKLMTRCENYYNVQLIANYWK